MSRDDFDQDASPARALDSVGLEDLASRIVGGSPPIVVDVRDEHELASGKIHRALHLPLRALERDAPSVLTERGASIVCICATGPRAERAASMLRAMGYANARASRGGMSHWLELGLPVENATTDPERERYARQRILPEVGERGQARLRSAHVAVVGVGGLGSPVAIYLACAGVGTLTLVDDDVVALSNLHRQIAHETHEIGASKVESAKRRIERSNPEVTVVPVLRRLDTVFARELARWGVDVIVDATDNFAARYALSDACLEAGVDLVHASVHRFEGQLTVFAPHRGGPCYRCLHPEPPPPGLAPACGEAGVLGVVPGVLGTLQATEVLKLLLGIGEPLVGRVLHVDLASARFRELRAAPSPSCSCRAQR
jgi:molybdopterin/thiamine biosynthesis adenylyltransferase/rhodanese-related sulfurtransferase